MNLLNKDEYLFNKSYELLKIRTHNEKDYFILFLLVLLLFRYKC
jgi:hypothetical protein